MIFKVQFSLWLVDALSVNELTFLELKEKWRNSPANIELRELTERSFSRYRKNIEDLFNIKIAYNRRSKTYKLDFLEEFEGCNFNQWLVSAFRLSNLSRHIDHSELVVLENPPRAMELLSTIVDALERKTMLHFDYDDYYKDETERLELIPAFVRFFKQQWYLIGLDEKNDQERVYALERISNLTSTKIKRNLKKKQREALSYQVYFKDCYGMIRHLEPLKIRIRAFWPQNKYIEQNPLHTSQRIIREANNFTDYELFVRPTKDFRQELLWHCNKIAVLSPPSFKESMIHTMQVMIKSYITGKYNYLDE